MLLRWNIIHQRRIYDVLMTAETVVMHTFLSARAPFIWKIQRSIANSISHFTQNEGNMCSTAAAQRQLSLKWKTYEWIFFFVFFMYV